MTNKLKYHKNHTEFSEPYQLVFPLNLEGLVPDDDFVRLRSHELEDLDYSLLYQAHSAKSRNPAVDPKTMFKILTYAYFQNIYSSRKIETACKRDINFIYSAHTFKDNIGIPVHQYIMKKRLAAVQDALRGGVKAGEACLQYGFKDYSVFYKAFKKGIWDVVEGVDRHCKKYGLPI